MSLANKLQAELVKTDNVGLTYISGGNPQQIRVEPDPEKLALFGVTLQQLVDKVRGANRSFQSGSVRDNDTMRNVAGGQTLAGIPDIGLLLVATRDNRPVYVRDVATVVIGPEPAGTPRLDGDAGGKAAIGIACRPSASPLPSAPAPMPSSSREDLLARLQSVEGRLVPADVNVTVTRDYGETANEKANELLFHLGLATVSIVVLIAFAIGWREALVTLVVIPTTILLTLFASKLMGYTINRVSLFALIFSIGILVDDAIVVVENIARHWAMKDGRTRMKAAVEAVAEVGNPTIVATLTVVAALLPMLFVSGLMGPYMAPIPANASAAMLFSFFVAMVIAPWLMLRLHPQGRLAARARGAAWRRRSRPPLSPLRRAGRALAQIGLAVPDRRRRGDLAGLRAVRDQERHGQALAVRQQVGNGRGGRSARGATLEDTERTLFSIADVARQLPEVRSIETYAGTPAPFNFNGLVRHYYIREAPELGELHLNLAPSGERKRASHAIALDLRARLEVVDLAGRHRRPRGRSAARSAGAGDAARRGLRAGLGNTPRCRRRAEEDLRVRALYRRHRRFDRQAAAAPAHLDRSGSLGIFRRRAARRLRYDPGAVRRHGGRLFAPRRGPQSDRNRRPSAETRTVLERVARLDAGCRQ